MDGDAVRTAAAVMGATGVTIGAFGAHALKATLTERKTLASFQTGVQYHLLHAAALLALSAVADASKRDVDTTAKCWIGGVVLFSGSIYGLSLGGPRILGPVTPLGGLLLIGGWVALAFASKKKEAGL